MMKLGRLPRAHDARVPHLSALLAGRKLAPPAPSIDYTQGMPPNLGVMLNNSLGDCTCAAYYHALQVWSFNARGVLDTQPDNQVLSLYEAACGYRPGNPATDQGGVEQLVLGYILNTGAPVTGGVQKLAAFVEVDPRVTDDIRLVVEDCGVCYIGFNVPAYLMSGLTSPGSTWNVQYSGTSIVGGHAVVVAGYDAAGVTVISWGTYYRMTWGFWAAYVDEAYALISAEWVRSQGVTPLGMTLAQLETQMEAIKA